MAELYAQKEKFISELSRLIAIDSTRTEKKPGAPFGEGAARVLAEAIKISAENGFPMKNEEGYAGEISFGKKPELMLLAHLDVVAAGDGWTHEPFRLTREGDILYGRGCTDDKGAALCLIYALKTARRLFGEPETGVKIVLGCAEETGSEDMEYYFSKHEKLKYTLSPDADYPLINIEKGKFAPEFEAVADGGTAGRGIIEINGGSVKNVVPGKADALLTGFSEQELSDSALAADTGARFYCKKKECGVRLYCEGKSSHAANPQKGCNAQTALLSVLARLPLDSSALKARLSGLCALFPHGETNGYSAGVEMSDEKSGALTLNFGVLSFSENRLSGALDLRVPLSADEKNLCAVLENRLSEQGFAICGGRRFTAAHKTDESSALVQTALEVYRRYTGQKAECLAIGGGTYVHGIEGGAAFGIEFPGCDYHIHGADEFAKADELLLTAAMYTQIIKDLCY